MKKLLKKSSLFLYVLSFLSFFLIGVSIAGITGAADGQGLAGGAIIVGYGVISGFIVFLISIVLVILKPNEFIIKINRYLVVLFLLIIIALFIRNFTRKDNDSAEVKKAHQNKIFYTTGFSTIDSNLEGKEKPIGLGFFKPDFYKIPTMYFYGNPNLNKSVQENTPTDSIVFKKTELAYTISYAPPWLYPDHLKLDYDILYFKVQSLGREFIEITVNSLTQQTAYISRFDGEILFWPEFLLSINSVEILAEKPQMVRLKPLDNSSEISTAFDFLKPISIRNEWMLVELIDNNYNTLDKGWIRWQKNGELLLTYSLLS